MAPLAVILSNLYPESLVKNMPYCSSPKSWGHPNSNSTGITLHLQLSQVHHTAPTSDSDPESIPQMALALLVNEAF